LTSYPDLFNALTGGSNNFGVVTRFDFLAFPLNDFLGGIIVYPISTFDANIAVLADLADSNQYDQNSTFYTGVLYSSETGSWSVFNSLFYTAQPALVNASALVPFTSIQPQLTNSMRVSNMSEFAAESQRLYSGNGPNR